jgi:hypothetical protein
MTDTMISQNINISSWDILYISTHEWMTVNNKWEKIWQEVVVA